MASVSNSRVGKGIASSGGLASEKVLQKYDADSALSPFRKGSISKKRWYSLLLLFCPGLFQFCLSNSIVWCKYFKQGASAVRTRERWPKQPLVRLRYFLLTGLVLSLTRVVNFIRSNFSLVHFLRVTHKHMSVELAINEALTQVLSPLWCSSRYLREESWIPKHHHLDLCLWLTNQLAHVFHPTARKSSTQATPSLAIVLLISLCS